MKTFPQWRLICNYSIIKSFVKYSGLSGAYRNCRFGNNNDKYDYNNYYGYPDFGILSMFVDI